MIRCLCCNRVIENPDKYESQVFWHKRCIKTFFGTKELPELDCSEKELERIANQSVNKGFTIPGVQKKLSIHLVDVDKTARLTIVDYPAGYILKPQSDEFMSLPEAEFLSMKMAESAKIKTVPNALMLVEDKYVYITKRIDRVDGQMLAMEDFCQLSGRLTEDKYRGSYENCGKVIRKYSGNIGIDMTEFFYRVLFCFLTGNSDMHLKNFSLIEEKAASRRFGLSAAYDLVPVNIIMPADHEQTALTLNGKKSNIRKKDFLSLEENLNIGEKTASGLLRQLLKHREKFINIVNDSYVSEEMKDSLKQLIDQRANVLM